MQQDKEALIDRLPVAVLGSILENVPQQQRLSQCALVCRQFAAAAALATASLQVRRLPAHKLRALESWISQHARQLLSITYGADAYPGSDSDTESDTDSDTDDEDGSDTPAATQLQLSPVELPQPPGPSHLQLPCAELSHLTALDLHGQMLLLPDPASTSSMHAAAAGGGSTPVAGAAGMLLRSGSKAASAHSRVQHAAASTAAAAAPTAAAGQDSRPLPMLQQLRLSSCKASSVQDLLRLSRLASLSSLQLSSVSVSRAVPAQPGAEQQQQQEPLSSALCMLLPLLTQLGELELCVALPGTGLSRVIQQLSSLQRLRGLRLRIDESAAHTGDLLASLPEGLTCLHVTDRRETRWPHRDRPAGLPRHLPQQLLAGLQQLVLFDASFDPRLLSGMQQLQHLHLEGCMLLPRGGDDDADAAAQRAAAGVLLAAVGCMTGLTELSIRGDRDNIFQQTYNTGCPAAYTALTASSQLQRLTFAGVDDLPLPWGALEHAFPPGRVLPHLKELTIEATSSHSSPVPNEWDNEHGDGFMSADGLLAVFAACPALMHLSIVNALEPGDLTPLLQLPTHVTSLGVGGEALDDAAAGVIKQLTQLRDLSWEASPDLTDAGLEQLTALQGLTYLYVWGMPGLSPEVCDDDGTPLEEGGSTVVVLPDVWGNGPKDRRPVWQQLQDRLDKSPELAPGRLERHKQDSAQLQQQVAQLQQQVGGLEQQNTGLQQQVAGLEQQNTGLQQQVADSQQEIERLQRHAAGLEQRLRAAGLLEA